MVIWQNEMGEWLVYSETITHTGSHVRFHFSEDINHATPLSYLPQRIRKEHLRLTPHEAVITVVLLNQNEQISCLHGNSELKMVADFTFYECKDCGFQSKQPPTRN